MSDELVALATRLIVYDTSEPEAVLEAAGFIKGWLEARGIEAEAEEVRGLPVLKAEVGAREGPTVVLHGHPAGEAVRWAGQNAVDLLVCASHHGLAHRVALGSFAHHLVNHAPCPVLVLRTPDAARDSPR